MSRRSIGVVIAAVGLVMMITGFLLSGGSSSTEPEAAATTAPPTSAPATTTRPPSTATSSTTTSAAAATSTTTTTTTSTTPPPPSIEDFVAEYAAAAESGDSAFLFDRLLPGIRDAFGAELCRSWVDREILAIGDYKLTGEITGPSSRSLTAGDTTIAVDEYYEAPVSFTFQGEAVDGKAAWVVDNGQLYWVGECR